MVKLSFNLLKIEFFLYVLYVIEYIKLINFSKFFRGNCKYNVFKLCIY